MQKSGFLITKLKSCYTEVEFIDHCRRQMKDALAKLEKEVQELHKEEQGKLEEEKKKALDRLQRLVSDCKVYKFVDTYLLYFKYSENRTN